MQATCIAAVRSYWHVALHCTLRALCMHVGCYSSKLHVRCVASLAPFQHPSVSDTVSLDTLLPFLKLWATTNYHSTDLEGFLVGGDRKGDGISALTVQQHQFPEPEQVYCMHPTATQYIILTACNPNSAFAVSKLYGENMMQRKSQWSPKLFVHSVSQATSMC